ncbi:UNVERIFIED_CONTAM: hypothetical protein K2H54_059745 [Gekko kuhli]
MRVIWSAKEDMSSDGETEVAAPMTSSGDGTRPRFRVLFRLAFKQRQRPIEVFNVTVQEIPPPAGSRAPKVKHLETKIGLGEKSPGTVTVPSGDVAPKAIGAETVPPAASIPGAESDPSTSMAYRYRRDGSGRTATGDDVSTPRPRNRCPPASTDLAVTTAPSALFSFWPFWPAAPIPLEAGTKET